MENQMDCLRPEGVAVHTTEFNVSSNYKTIARGPLVIFRRRDIEKAAARLRAKGHSIDLDFDSGTSPADLYVDLPPYKEEPHLKLKLGEFVSTSIGLAVRKNPCASESGIRAKLRALFTFSKSAA